MTETVSGTQRPTPRTPGRGLTLQRIYTTAGVHPYDEVAYLRFASVYRGFDSLADFEAEIAALRTPRPPERGSAPAPPYADSRLN